jgi:hypothetical protein
VLAKRKNDIKRRSGSFFTQKHPYYRKKSFFLQEFQVHPKISQFAMKAQLKPETSQSEMFKFVSELNRGRKFNLNQEL